MMIYCARGYTRAQTATELGLAVSTVRNIINRMLPKAGATCLAHATIEAILDGIITREEIYGSSKETSDG